MKAIRLRKIRKAFEFKHLNKSVIVTAKKTGKLQEFPTLREAIGFAMCELFGFGTGCRYYQIRLDRLIQSSLRIKLKAS